MSLPKDILAKASTIARGLAMDAVHASQSGHLGLPLGCAEIGAVLYGHALSHCPRHPEWLNRDRFVLSAGHGSMFLYAWLHLSGYREMTLDEVKRFRQLNSATPGHPEFPHGAPNGIETTSGPLGQGIANAVGMAVAAKMAEAHFNTPEDPIFDHHIVCLAGDGCMQEGVAMEAVSFAGHQKLDNLILIYDSNAVTLDAMAKETQSEDAAKRFEAIGFDVETVDGHEMEAFVAAFERAKKAGSGKPQLIIAKTLIGKGIPEVAGTQKAHGEAGAKFIPSARKALGLPDETFYVSAEVRTYFAEHAKGLDAAYDAWVRRFDTWKTKNPKLAEQLAASRAFAQTLPSGTAKTPDTAALLAAVPAFPSDSKIATRKAGQDVLQPLAAKVPLLTGGSADLYGSTLNYIGDLKTGNDDFNAGHRSGRNIRFGIREHGMCSILNGIAAHGIFRASGATFLVFADYCRAAIRLAALSHLPVIYVFTHDSVGVGEDGPTHEPVETIPGLRVIPNLDVIRPADPEETAGAFAAALERTEGPTLLALTRQAVPLLTGIPVETRRQGVLKGGYVAKKETAALDLILMSAGSELQHALKASEALGPGTRVVSMPCFARFDRQPAAYKDEVLPRACRRRVSVEATVTRTWAAYVGIDGASVGIDRFGLSAPGVQVMTELGITSEHVVEVAKGLKAASK
jgi:transketolase